MIRDFLERWIHVGWSTGAKGGLSLLVFKIDNFVETNISIIEGSTNVLSSEMLPSQQEKIK